MTKPKTTTRHPYAAIEHRVIDSPAYADLTFSARALLVLLARQLTKDNNGRLQATFSYMQRFGFASAHTLSRSIQELITHGFIYRARSGGYQQGAAQYAVTWLSIKRSEGLFLTGFKPCAWREWQPPEKKSRPPKMHRPSCKNGTRTALTSAETALSRPPKNAHNELMPVGVREPARYGVWIQPELARLAALGLGERQCFQLPSRTLQ